MEYSEKVKIIVRVRPKNDHEEDDCFIFVNENVNDSINDNRIIRLCYRSKVSDNKCSSGKY